MGQSCHLICKSCQYSLLIAHSFQYCHWSLFDQVDPDLGKLEHGHVMREREQIFSTPEFREYDADIHSMTNEELKKFEKQKSKARCCIPMMMMIMMMMMMFSGLELIMSVYAISVSVNFLVSLSLLAGVKVSSDWSVS